MEWKEATIAVDNLVSDTSNSGDSCVSQQNLVYSFTFTPTDCLFQITNFNSAWKEYLSATEIEARGKEFGYNDIRTDSKRSQLLAILKASVYNDDSRPVFTLKDNDINVVVDSTDVKWNFCLTQMSPSEAADFFAELNFNQFANLDYLQFQICQLQDLIKSKDHYIKFLTENFKQANGARFLQKYRKNNPTSMDAVSLYQPEKWKSKMVLLYRERCKNLQKKASSPQKLKWKLVRSGISEKWTFAKSYKLNEPIENDADEIADSKEMSIRELQPLDSERLSSPMKSKSISPRKRQRIGIVSTRKKRKPGMSLSQMSSQLMNLLSSQLPVLSAEDSPIIPSSPTKLNPDDPFK